LVVKHIIQCGCNDISQAKDGDLATTLKVSWSSQTYIFAPPGQAAGKMRKTTIVKEAIVDQPAPKKVILLSHVSRYIKYDNG
jgi:hypothetical protein